MVGRLGDRWARVYEADALLERRSLLRHLRSAGDGALERAEASRFSQNGEDGVIAALIERVGAPSRTFAEIGASDGGENCTRALVEDGWKGAWFEGDPDRVRLARERALPGVEIVEAFVDRGNVGSLLAAAGVPEELDVLVVDIDGDDLGVLQSALRQHRARIVVVEYNAAFRPPLVWATPPGKATGWDGTYRFGASLQAFVDALRVDYRLVHCDTTGVNAFFVRVDLAGRVGPVGDVDRLFRPAAFSQHPFGHVRSRAALAPMEAVSLSPGDVRLEPVGDLTSPLSAPAGEAIPIDVVVVNHSKHTLSSGRPVGFNLVLRWLDDVPSPPRDDAPRTTLPHPVAPGERRRMVLWARTPPQPGRRALRVTAVLEGAAWLEHLGGPGSVVDLEVDVTGPPVRQGSSASS